MATSGTLDSKLLRPDPLVLLPMLEDGDGDLPYSWNLRRRRTKVSCLFLMRTFCFSLWQKLSRTHLYGW